MCSIEDLPEILESKRINDILSAEKYEVMSLQKRALIKNALAFHFSFHTQKEATESYNFNKNSGFLHGCQQTNCDYALFILPQNFNSPAKFIASICPAIIAGVENIFVLMPKNVADSIWVSLELAGIEQVFILSHEEILPYSTMLIEHLNGKKLSCGRVVLFDDNAIMTHELEKRDVQYYVDKKILSIYASEKQEEILKFAYGDVIFYPLPLMPEKIVQEESAPEEIVQEEIINDDIHNYIKEISVCFDVKKHKYANISFSKHYPASQYFEEGMDVCYVHPHVDRNFFMNIRMSSTFVLKDLI